MRKIGVLTLSLLFTAGSLLAQQGGEAKKPLSPPARTAAKIGGVDVSVDYSAPSKRGRAIMGGLVPYGKVWRTGANAATSLKVGGDLMIGDLHVPAGSYTLYTIPGEKSWTLIVNRQTGQWGTNYDESQDLGRVSMTVAPVKDTVETFGIEVKPGSGKTGTLSMTWENVRASVPLTAH